MNGLIAIIIIVKNFKDVRNDDLWDKIFLLRK